jgi:hypothetical protein
MGENPAARRAMEETERRLISGGFRPERAAEIARESALRVDIREQGGTPPPRRPDAGNTPRR